MGSKGSLACRSYLDTGTGMSEDVFYLLAIRGPTCGEGKRGIEPGSSDPKSSPLPLRHRGGLLRIWKIRIYTKKGSQVYVTGRQHNTSCVSDMLQHLNWRSLSDRRTDARLTMFYKIVHNKVAIPNRQTYSSSSLRLSRNMHEYSFQIPSCRTQVRQNSFFPRTIKHWNNLPPNTVTGAIV